MVGIGAFDLGSLERFQSELVQEGFEPLTPNGREWVGPLEDSFAALTQATQMRLEFRDGWPFKPPRLYVSGLSNDHVNPAGEVCLWREDDGHPEDWITFEAFRRRIHEWCERARDGFAPNDLGLDAHLYYEDKSDELAIFDPHAIIGPRPHDGDMGHLHGVVQNAAVHLLPNQRRTGAIRGRWYYRTRLELPPRNLDEFHAILARGQARNFERLLRELSREEAPHLALLVWETPRGRNALALLLKPNPDKPQSLALVVAPSDTLRLLVRAGPDAQALEAKRVTVFRMGAIGSHLALLLAESGIGALTIVDGSRLRPGNVTRHAAGHGSVGLAKVEAVRQLIADSAPWTKVEIVGEALWTPARLAELAADADLVVDATGIGGFTDACSKLFKDKAIPFLTFALFRAGSIGRIRRQANSDDEPILSRIENPGAYPLIPPDPALVDEPLEAGCSAPINNAPPHAVVALAASATQCTIDWLLGRSIWPDEVIEIYSPLEAAPFDAIGRIAILRPVRG